MSEHSTNASASRRSGFSLLEVVIALGILAFGVLGVTAGHLMALRVSSSSRTAALAMDLAEAQMEVFQAMPAADVTALALAVGYPNDPSNPIDPDPDDDTTMVFNRRWLITPDSPEVGVIAITVEVDWVNPIGNTVTTRIAGLKAST